MRFVPSITPATTTPLTRQVKQLSATHAVKPVHVREQTVPDIGQHNPNPDALRSLAQQQRESPAEDRRKACRRVSHQPVLIELRSGFDRRRHNLRVGDVVEHIDEEV